MRGPHGKGYAEMAVARVPNCGFETPVTDRPFDQLETVRISIMWHHATWMNSDRAISSSHVGHEFVPQSRIGFVHSSQSKSLHVECPQWSAMAERDGHGQSIPGSGGEFHR